MTSNSGYNETTTATEVARGFGDYIRGKNGKGLREFISYSWVIRELTYRKS